MLVINASRYWSNKSNCCLQIAYISPFDLDHASNDSTNAISTKLTCVLLQRGKKSIYYRHPIKILHYRCNVRIIPFFVYPIIVKYIQHGCFSIASLTTFVAIYNCNAKKHIQIVVILPLYLSNRLCFVHLVALAFQLILHMHPQWPL